MLYKITNWDLSVETELGDNVLRNIGLDGLLDLTLRSLQKPIELLRVKLLHTQSTPVTHDNNNSLNKIHHHLMVNCDLSGYSHMLLRCQGRSRHQIINRTEYRCGLYLMCKRQKHVKILEVCNGDLQFSDM